MNDLKAKMARGAAWLVLFRIIDRSIGFVSTLILARLLVPADFGLVAMGTSILAALEIMGAFSFDIALIQNQQAQRKHYDTAWTFAVIFGVIKALLMCVLAAPAATFFAEPRVEPLMYALGLCTLIQGFDNIGVVAFQKDLELKKEFWFGLSKRLIGFVVTIAAAWHLQSYWALVIGTMANRLSGLVLSYCLHPYRPRLSLAAIGELFHFSKWLLLNNVLIFLNNRGTDFVIGKLGGPKALGTYSISYEIANLPTTELVFPISRAVFPGYAKLANDKPELRRAFLQVMGMIALLTIPAGVGIAALAAPLVHLLLGPSWLDAIPLIEVLALFGVVRSIHGPTGSVYLALGKPRMVAVLQCVQLSIAISLMLLLIPSMGVLGAAWAILAGALVAMTVNYLTIMRDLEVRLASLLSVAWRPIAAGCAMGALLTLLQRHWPLDGRLSVAAMQVGALSLLGAVCFICTVLLFWHLSARPVGPEQQLLQLLKQRLRGKRPATAD